MSQTPALFFPLPFSRDSLHELPPSVSSSALPFLNVAPILEMNDFLRAPLHSVLGPTSVLGAYDSAWQTRLPNKNAG